MQGLAGEHVQWYRHHKGEVYGVLCRAFHTETGERLVIYCSHDGSQIFARPADMFFGNAIVSGKLVKRFAPLEQ